MDQREWDYGVRLPRDRRAAESWSLENSPEDTDLSTGVAKWQSITDTGSLEPSPEALAWAQRADQWAQQPNPAEQRGGQWEGGPASRWSEVIPTGTTPADGVGWRTETAEWRATSARWRQTTEWRSSTGTEGWRSTTEAWQTGEAGAEGFPPSAAPPTGGPLAISGGSLQADDQPESGQQEDGGFRTENYNPAGESRSGGGRQQFTQPAAPDPPWQQPAAPDPPWQQPALAPPWQQAAPAQPWQQGDGWQQAAPSTPPWESSAEAPWQQFVTPDDGRHLVREDDRAQWRQSAAGAAGLEERTRQIGRRRAPDEGGTRAGAGSGWSTRSEADNWAGHTDTGSMQLFQDPALGAWQDSPDQQPWRAETTAPDWRTESRTNGEAPDWRARPEAAQWQEPDNPSRRTQSEAPDWRARTEAPDWRREPPAAPAQRRRDTPEQPPEAQDNWRTRSITPGWRGDAPATRSDADVPDWRTGDPTGRADLDAPSWRTAAPAEAPDWRTEALRRPIESGPRWDDESRRGADPRRQDDPRREEDPRWEDDPPRRDDSHWEEDPPRRDDPGWEDESPRRDEQRWAGDGRRTEEAESDWRTQTGAAPRGRQDTGRRRIADDDWRGRPDDTDVADWRDSTSTADWRTEDDERPRRRVDADAPDWRPEPDDWREPEAPPRRHHQDDWRREGPAADPWAPGPADDGWDTPARVEAPYGRRPAIEPGRRPAIEPPPRRRAEVETPIEDDDDDEPPRSGPVSPELRRGAEQPMPYRQNWRTEPLDDERTQSWRRELQEEQGIPVGEAATDTRAPIGWRAARDSGGVSGSAAYREGRSGDWRRDLAAEDALAGGESRQFGTSGFVPFKAPGLTAAGTASVPAPRPAAGLLSVGQTGTGRWQDPPDTQWPPRPAVGYDTETTGSYERRSVSTLLTASGRQNNLLEPDEDEIEESTSGPLAAVGYTVIWYGVPVVLFVLYTLVLTGNQQAQAFSTLANAAPQFGLSLVLSMLVAVGLRWASGSWKAASVGLAAAVLGGGLATVLTSAITGNSLS